MVGECGGMGDRSGELRRSVENVCAWVEGGCMGVRESVDG